MFKLIQYCLLIGLFFQTVTLSYGTLLRSYDALENNIESLKGLPLIKTIRNFPASSSSTAAGVLHYAEYNHQIYILLGRRDDGTSENGEWCNFGGASDGISKKEVKSQESVESHQHFLTKLDQTLADTAAREVIEESSGIYAHHPRLLRQQPYIDVYFEDKPAPNFYRMYWQEVQYLDAHILKGHVEGDNSHSQEYTNFKWVKASTLLKSVLNSNPLLSEEGDESPIEIYASLFANLLTEGGKAFLSHLTQTATLNSLHPVLRRLGNRLYITTLDAKEERQEKEEKLMCKTFIHWDLPKLDPLAIAKQATDIAKKNLVKPNKEGGV